ncbi:MAG TPA: tyrosine-type recombinase/integrase [Jatrophihabitantaceae bacterium]|nr:tyrosine-type recombinase/integrase [Jatrophihabitantaceae bacterium]
MSSPLEDRVDEYLRLRRALGYRLEREERWLRQLVGHVQAAGAGSLTSGLMINWARQSATAQPRHWAQRLGCARKFAIFLHTVDPATEVPPTGVFPIDRHRPTPYLWSAEDVERLLEAARRLRPPLRGLTYQTVFGLLAVSGMRLGEVIGLRRDDIDFDTAVITIRHAKFDRPRIVPLHPTATAALDHYASQRDQLGPRPRVDAFFLSTRGNSLNRSEVDKTLRQLTTATGIRTATVHPRAHDLRHSFAVHTLIRWLQQGVGVDENMAVLSTYLGHVSPAGTYWYLSAVPELLQLAAGRLQMPAGVR